jgi:hypothetical protein
MAKRFHHDEGYAGGYKASRKMMHHDGMMIHEDHAAACLLPHEIIEKEWPRAENDHMGFVEDKFYGVEKQMHEDYSDLGKEMDPKKY